MTTDIVTQNGIAGELKHLLSTVNRTKTGIEIVKTLFQNAAHECFKSVSDL